MPDPTTFTPYSTVRPMIGAMPSWVPDIDQERIASYQKYEEMYWNVPDTWKLVARGSENKPIYVPTPKIIVNTMHRWVGGGLRFLVDPAFGQKSDQDLATQLFTALFRRERFLSKYNANKRLGLTRGDWLFHVVGDGDKAKGTRLSIYTVDPAAYFPVHDDDNLDRVIKVHLAEPFIGSAEGQFSGRNLIRRLTYEKVDEEGGRIYVSEALFEVDKWKSGKGEPIKVLMDRKPLHPDIKAIPVYHIPNREEPNNPFGSSELRGCEMLQRGINQSVSDEDLALALDGLGVYATGSGKPVDDEGNETNWTLGPGRVVENVQDFKRVNGVGSITPMQEHIGFMVNMLRESSGVTDAASGKVDVQVAESGVALLLQLAPTLAQAEESDTVITDKMMQFFFDLKTWFRVYEQANIDVTDVVPVLGDKLPKNTKAAIESVIQLMSTTPPIISAGTAREYLKMHTDITFDAEEGSLIAQEQQAHTEVTTPPDAFTSRMQKELDALAANDGAGADSGSTSA
jgi:hypothetical protein